MTRFFVLAAPLFAIACAAWPEPQEQLQEQPQPQVQDLPLQLPSQPPAGSVNLRAITYGGSGCPQGSLNVVVDDSGTQFEVQPPAFTARLGINSRPTDFRKNCQVNLDLTYPEGYQYRINRVLNYTGHASLQDGVNATIRTVAYFSGQTAETVYQRVLGGPTEADWTILRASGRGQVWSPCGNEGLLNVNSQIRLAGSATNGTSTITLEAGPSFGITWRRCGGAQRTQQPLPPYAISQLPCCG